MATVRRWPMITWILGLTGWLVLAVLLAVYVYGRMFGKDDDE